MDLVIREEISILGLSTRQKGDKRIHQRGKPRVSVERINEGGRVQPFVSIRVCEEKARAKAILFTGRDAKVIDAARGFQLLPLMKDRLFRIDSLARRPKRIDDLDLAGGEFLHEILL